MDNARSGQPCLPNPEEVKELIMNRVGGVHSDLNVRLQDIPDANSQLP